eukprot:3914830-Rhodomonas_salina.1
MELLRLGRHNGSLAWTPLQVPQPTPPPCNAAPESSLGPRPNCDVKLARTAASSSLSCLIVQCFELEQGVVAVKVVAGSLSRA